jgi:tetratricopeptide (TPR) repeat protein
MDHERTEFLKQRLAENPDDTFARYGLALELAKSDHPDGALEHFEYLLTRHPEYSPTYYQASAFMLQNGKYDEARRILEKGIEVTHRQGALHAEQELRSALEEMPSGQ